MGWCKKDVTPLLTHWSYVLLALTIKIFASSLIAQSAGDLLSQTLQLRILHSAKEDNLSPFDSKTACLRQRIKINNEQHVVLTVPTHFLSWQLKVFSDEDRTAQGSRSMIIYYILHDPHLSSATSAISSIAEHDFILRCFCFLGSASDLAFLNLGGLAGVSILLDIQLHCQSPAQCYCILRPIQPL